jgi:hypothetical protein
VWISVPERGSENLWPGSFDIQDKEGKGYKNLNVVVRKCGTINLYVNGHRYWEYTIGDPDALDMIRDRCVEFAQAEKVEDLDADDRFKPIPWFSPAGMEREVIVK